MTSFEGTQTAVAERERAGHRAGHVVAAALRGAGRPLGPTVGLDDDLPAWDEIPTGVRPFVAYAGPWAEARSRWALRPFTGEDATGRTFDDHVGRALLLDADDAMVVGLAEFDVATMLRDGGADDTECWRWLRGVHYAWNAELEDVWPVVEHVSGLLLAGRRVALDDVRARTDDVLATLYC